MAHHGGFLLMTFVGCQAALSQACAMAVQQHWPLCLTCLCAPYLFGDNLIGLCSALSQACAMVRGISGICAPYCCPRG